jgi:hypothetical protein
VILFLYSLICHHIHIGMHLVFFGKSGVTEGSEVTDQHIRKHVRLCYSLAEATRPACQEKRARHSTARTVHGGDVRTGWP